LQGIAESKKKWFRWWTVGGKRVKKLYFKDFETKQEIISLLIKRASKRHNYQEKASYMGLFFFTLFF